MQNLLMKKKQKFTRVKNGQVLLSIPAELRDKFSTTERKDVQYVETPTEYIITVSK